MIWRDLKTDPPTGPRSIILFPCITDVGHVYTVSNPEYARAPHALEHGYRLWADIDPAPGEAEAEAYNLSLD